jgi:hypothetical protein
VFAGDPLFHLKLEAAMDDRVAKLFAGHMGVSAVLANILIEKKVVSREEAIFHFRQAHDAASKCSGGIDVAQALAAMISYLDEGQDTH